MLRNATRRHATIAADDFFIGPMMTALPPGACVTEVRFPVWPKARIGVGFHEISARRSDFALVAAAAQVALDASGRCTRLRARHRRRDGRAAAARGRSRCARSGRICRTARSAKRSRAAAASLEIMSSPHASDDYRRRAAATLGAPRARADARDALRGGGRPNEGGPPCQRRAPRASTSSRARRWSTACATISPHRRAHRLRARHLRRLHGADRRRAGARPA